MSHSPVVILGAGPAGLAAGVELTRAGLPVVILEQLEQVGGVSRTVNHDGFRYDLGGHRWYTRNESVDKFVHGLLQDELISVPRKSHIYFDGRYIRYPLKLADALRVMGFTKSIGAIASFLYQKVTNALAPKQIRSMQDAYSSQFGRVLYDHFFKGYSEKLWGSDCSELSGDWVTQRSQGMSILQVVKDAIVKSDRQSLIEQFEYPSMGIGRISELMEDEIRSKGGEILFGHQVTGFELAGKTIKSVQMETQDGSKTFACEQVLSSLPLPQSATWLDAENKVSDSIKQLRFRGLVFVTLFISVPSVTSDSWIYLQDERLTCTRMHEPTNWSREMAPDEQTALVFEIGCDQGDELWNSSDEHLMSIVKDELVDQLGFVSSEHIISGQVVREAHAYPVYNLDYVAHRRRVLDFVEEFQNLIMIGRNGLFRYNNMDHSIESGFKAAQNLMGAGHDLELINASQDYLERNLRGQGIVH